MYIFHCVIPETVMSKNVRPKDLNDKISFGLIKN